MQFSSFKNIFIDLYEILHIFPYLNSETTADSFVRGKNIYI